VEQADDPRHHYACDISVLIVAWMVTRRWPHFKAPDHGKRQSGHGFDQD